MGITTAVRDMRTTKQLLERAEAEARARGDEIPGPEHLLLAATALPDGSALRTLERVGVDADRLRGAIEDVHAQALADSGIEVASDLEAPASLRGPASRVYRSSPQAQQVFQQSVALSQAAHPHGLTGAHVIAAVCDLERGTAARALAALGVDRDRLRQAALAEVRAD